MIRLILVRHGNTFEEGETPLQIGARTDLPLTAFGREQAEKMAHSLIHANISPSACFSGSLQRQRQTAERIAAPFHLAVQPAAALNEIDYGLWEGKSAEEIRRVWPSAYAEWNEKALWQSQIFQGSEAGHRKNLSTWWALLRKEYEGKTLIAVTSNGLLRLIRNEKVQTGHFCELEVEAETMRILSWNQNPERGFSQ